MATTINSYKVSLALDASEYIKKSELSRNETNALKREINSARTPADNYTRSLNLVKKAYHEGAIDGRIYNRLLESTESKLKRAGVSSGTLTSSIKKLAAAWLSFHAANALLRAALQNTLEVMRDIDATAKRARGIDENYNSLRRFQFAAGELAGVDGPAAVELLSKLTKKVGEASLGLGEAKKAFELLGVSIQDFQGMSPVEQFERVRDAISKIEDPTKRVAIAVKLFESEGKKLLPLLLATSDAYEESAKQVDRFGLALDTQDIEKIEKTNDEIERMKAGVEGLFTTLAKTDGIIGGLETVTTALQMMNIGLEDLVNRWDTIKKINPFNIMGSAGRIAAGAAAGGPVTDIPEGQTRRRHPTGVKQTGIRFGPELPSEKGFFEKSLSGGEGLGGVIDSAMQGLKTGGGGLMDIASAVHDSAFMIATSGAAQTQELIKATTEDPAIASLEVGTQEAYEFLTQATRDAEKEEREHRKKQEDLAKNRDAWEKKTTEWQDKVLEVWEKNGFTRFR